MSTSYRRPVSLAWRAARSIDSQCPFAIRRQQVRTIKTIRKRVSPVSRFNTAFATLKASPAGALARKEASDTIPLRSGALATKKGMSALYDPETGKRTPCTVLQLDRVQVIGTKTREKNGYYAVCVGHSWRTPQRINNAMLGVFAKAQYENEAGGKVGVSPKKDVREFRVKDASGLLGIGAMITPSWFREGQFVDARAPSRGHGFTGVSQTLGRHLAARRLRADEKCYAGHEKMGLSRPRRVSWCVSDPSINGFFGWRPRQWVKSTSREEDGRTYGRSATYGTESQGPQG